MKPALRILVVAGMIQGGMSLVCAQMTQPEATRATYGDAPSIRGASPLSGLAPRADPIARLAPPEPPLVPPQASSNPQRDANPVVSVLPIQAIPAPSFPFDVQRQHISPLFLGPGITNMPVNALSAVDQAQMARLFDDLAALTQAPAHPLVRQHVANNLLASVRAGQRPRPESVLRFVNTMALVTPGLALTHPHQVLLTRNIHLLIAHGAALTDVEAQALLWQTQALLQIGALLPPDVHLLTLDLATIMAETRQAPWARG
jgi:hypothetical protein